MGPYVESVLEEQVGRSHRVMAQRGTVGEGRPARLGPLDPTSVRLVHGNYLSASFPKCGHSALPWETSKMAPE